MAITEKRVQELIALLNLAHPVTSRKMFGGVGIYADGVFMAVIDDDRLYFKVDDSTLVDYLEHDAAQWVIPMNPPVMANYRELPDVILNDPEICAEWIERAKRVAQTKKRPTRKPKKAKLS